MFYEYDALLDFLINELPYLVLRFFLSFPPFICLAKVCQNYFTKLFVINEHY